MQELVSIVVPIYNVEKYLDRCIESIVAQTYKKLEIILVDDGSSDNCPSMCDEWQSKDSRIKVIHKENAGAGMARNTGLDNAAGKYIFFFDSDDYVDITTVEKCVLNAKENDSDIVMYGRCDVYKDLTVVKNKFSPEKLIFDKESIKNELLPGLFTYDIGLGISVWGKMFRTDVINNNGIRFKSEREIVSEDAFFILEVFSKISRASIIPENLYFYFKNENSFSRTYKKNRQKNNNIFLQKSLEFVDNVGYPKTVALHVTARYHIYTIAYIKQIFAAELSWNEKYRELQKIFKDSVLRSTLKRDVLKLDTFVMRMFWIFLKLKCYYVCYFLLWCKNCKKV